MKRSLTGPGRAERPDDGNAFIPDPVGERKALPADAESFAEEFIGSATRGEPVNQEAEDEVTDDEEGGPFIVLDEDAKLPTQAEEEDPEREGHESIEHEQNIRGAKWAARGA